MSRYRHVRPSHEVYHLWANRVWTNGGQSDARNSSYSVSFDGECAYSYRAVIARWIAEEGKSPVVLFSSHRWSVTTAKHQTRCRRALPSFAQVFTVPSIGDADAKPNHLDNLRYYRNGVEDLTGKAQRARKYGEYYRDEYLTLQQEANEYCRYFGISEAFDAGTLDKAIEAARIEREARKAAERERLAQADNELRLEYAARAEAWRTDLSVSLPYYYPDTLLRLNGDNIETSRGAFVPVSHAQRLYRKLHNGTLTHGDRAGDYSVREVHTDAVQIGCHYITLAEVERLAVTLGWWTARGGLTDGNLPEAIATDGSIAVA